MITKRGGRRGRVGRRRDRQGVLHRYDIACVLYFLLARVFRFVPFKRLRLLLCNDGRLFGHDRHVNSAFEFALRRRAALTIGTASCVVVVARDRVVSCLFRFRKVSFHARCERAFRVVRIRFFRVLVFRRSERKGVPLAVFSRERAVNDHAR